MEKRVKVGKMVKLKILDSLKMKNEFKINIDNVVINYDLYYN